MTNENIFAQFTGADLDRFIECLKKVREEGLTIDEHAQAGINPNSGNVYIWSDYWAACVYCSIGFDVRWSYSCPECGEEYDFDTEQEARDYQEKHDYECASCNTLDSEEE